LNGTFVQNVRLHAHHPHVLQPGDELQFGKVVLKITWSS
jgi:pSer/pThr/pTyr-binding forkhead associated (FHA) protein